MRTETYALNCTTDGSKLGTVQPVPDMLNKTVQGGAGYTGSITIEGSIITDVWTTIGTVAAAASLSIPGAWLKIRTNCTTVTGGSAPTATLCADNSRVAYG